MFGFLSEYERSSLVRLDPIFVSKWNVSGSMILLKARGVSILGLVD